MSKYPWNKSVKMKIRYLKALLCFDWGHQIWNKVRNGHIVGINEVMMSPIDLLNYWHKFRFAITCENNLLVSS